MNFVMSALYNFNILFSLDDFSEYGDGYLATLAIITPITKRTFTDIALLISMLERKYSIVKFDSFNEDEFTLYLAGGDDN